MAGGVGSRFWPASTSKTPKQFLDILGTGQSLIQQTYERFQFVCEPDSFLIVTNEDYKDIVMEQLPELKEDQVLTEPMMRNTAPCIAYAAYKIAAIDNEANLIVTPADHLILKQKEFETTVNSAIDHISEYDDLVTLGIKPTRPDTGYGYIEYEAGSDRLQTVKQFREKPNLSTAEGFVESGNFAWNSGMFFWSLATILEAFEKHLPLVKKCFDVYSDKFMNHSEGEVIDKLYNDCPAISIDFGIMEKADNVKVIEADIGWSDLGTWGSVYDVSEKDANQNVIISGKALLENASGNVINLTPEKVAILQDVQDLIIVETKDALLISSKKSEQNIKPLRAKLGQQFGDEHI
jgi:mannose-1-phosphate guanylyltransferase